MLDPGLRSAPRPGDDLYRVALLDEQLRSGRPGGPVPHNDMNAHAGTVTRGCDRRTPIEAAALRNGRPEQAYSATARAGARTSLRARPAAFDAGVGGPQESRPAHAP
ncbi:hypothetical protein GCM10017688_50390 [Streptomyces ramulosus]